MALNPDEIENKQFTIGLRGFDRDEVEDYLGKVSRHMRRLDDELSNAEANAASATADAVAARESQASLEVPPVLEPVVPEALTAPHRKAPASLEEDLEYFTDDRFTEFGDRMAALLRLAHEDAAAVRAKAEADAEEAREASEAAKLAATEAAAEIRAEADEYRTEVRAEAEAYREEVKAEAEAYRGEVKAEADAERNVAAQELQAARDESAELLSQARSQSEFIQHEADEMSRAKIRDNVDAAEKRLSILRTTEVSSRERIQIAQNELQAALAKLEESPLQELSDPSVADGILEEATAKAAELVPAADDDADDDADVEPADSTEIEVDEVIEIEEIAEVDDIGDVAEVDEVEIIEDVETLEGVEDAQEPDHASGADDPDADDADADDIETDEVESDAGRPDVQDRPADDPFDNPFRADAETDVDVVEIEDVVLESDDDDADSSLLADEIELPDIPGVDSIIESDELEEEVTVEAEVEDEPAEVVDDIQDSGDSNGSDSTNAPWWAKKRKNTDSAAATPPPPPPPPPTGAVSVVASVPSSPQAPGDSPLSGVAEAARAAAQEMNSPEVETPDNEDALARLVREAMQKAVEGARGPES